MEIKLNIPDYSIDKGFKFEWEYGFEIDAKMKFGSVVVTANKAGLLSLAKQLLFLAQDEVPMGYHFHLDETNSLEQGSLELIIQKK